MKPLLISGCLLAVFFAMASRENGFPKLDGPDLGQKTPGMTPEIFAPGVVTSEHQEHSSLAFSPDGKDIWWSRWRLPYEMDKFPQVIMFIRHENGAWSRKRMDAGRKQRRQVFKLTRTVPHSDNPRKRSLF